MALRTTTRPALALWATRPALALRSSLVLLLRTRPRTPWAFCSRPSGVSAAALDSARLWLGLTALLRRRLLPSLRGLLLPHLWATRRLHVGTLLARS